MSEENKNEIQQKFLDVDPENLIAKWKEGLGFFGRKAVQQMEEIYVVMFEIQKEIIEQKCALDLDIKKKDLFFQYVLVVEGKNQEMSDISANIIAALNNILYQKTKRNEQQLLINISDKLELALENFHNIFLKKPWQELDFETSESIMGEQNALPNTTILKEISDNMSEERKNEIQQKFLDVDSENLIVKMQKGLSFFGRKAAQQMKEIYVVMLESQKEMILQKCALGLDLEKKKLFIQYAHAAEKKSEMFEMSADIIVALNDIISQKSEQIDDTAYEQLRRLEERKKSGKISEDVYNLRKQDIEKRRESEQQLLADTFAKLVLALTRIRFRNL